MKKILLFFIIMPLFGLISCNDMLEVFPENSVTFENAIRNEKDLESMVTSIRSVFRSEISDWSNRHIFWRGVITIDDDGFTDEYVLDAIQLGRYVHTANGIATNWTHAYSAIATTHVVLDNAHLAENISPERLKFYVGQAYFYRAYTYLFLAQSYGDVPLVTNGRDVGDQAKSSWEDVLQQVMDDAQKAIEMLPPRDQLYSYSGAKINTNDVPCYESACMLKAHACAWRASLNRDIYKKEEPELFAEAIRLATEVIDSPNYNLVSTSEQVCTEVLMGDSREGIFEVKNELRNLGLTSFTTARLYATYPARKEHTMQDISVKETFTINARITNEQVKRIYGEQNDQRLYAYFYEFDEMAAMDTEITGGFAYPNKFRNGAVWDSGYDKGKFQNFDQDHVIYRLADIILLRAELYARTNQTALAIADLKRVRNRAYGMETVYPMPDVDNPTRDLRYHIFKERERELLWEDQRYFDIVRNSYYNTEIDSRRFRELTIQDVKDGAIYIAVANRSINGSLLITQNRYWANRFREN